jgi:peptidoglycan/LPS O-acetylase OafA/YrhL
LSVGEYLLHPHTWHYLRNCLLYIGYSLPGVFEENPYPRAVNGSLWTLPVEGVMYLLVLVLGLTRALNISALTVVVAGLCAIKFLLIPYLGHQDATWGRLFPVAQSVKLGLFFFSGAVLYVARPHLVIRNIAACSLFAALLATVRTPVGPVAYQVALPLLTIWAAHANVRWMREFGRHGDFSYGMYLIAFPVQQLLAHKFGSMPVPVFMALAFGTTLPLAILSWHCVEKPALAWKQKTVSFDAIRRLRSSTPTGISREIPAATQDRAPEMTNRAA